MLLCKRGNYGVEHSVIPRGETREEKRKLWGRGNLLRDGLSYILTMVEVTGLHAVTKPAELQTKKDERHCV